VSEATAVVRPLVDVVILTWNDGELLDAAVRSALDSDGVGVRVTVVDNGSSPPATVPDDPRVRLVRNQANRGVAAGRNQGIAVGEASLVCVLDSDARLHRTSLRVLAGALLGDDAVGLVSPVFDGQTASASGGRAPTLLVKSQRALGVRSTYRPTRRRHPAGLDVDFTIGACQLFRRAAWTAEGGLDESFFYGPEDVEFCLRLRRAGWRVLQVPEAGCHHPPRRRNRRLLTGAGMRHGLAVARHLWRQHRLGALDEAR
jgi:hypothetical protein